MIVGATLGHMAKTMFDKDKGSMTNRFECAKEHAKNDLKTGVKVAVPLTGATALGFAKLAGKNSKVSIGVTKSMAYLGTGLAKLAKLVKGNKLAEIIMKNPAKYGAIGLGIAAGIYTLDTLFKFENQRGRIDQKYEDSAKIESQTKNVILAKQLEEAQVTDFAC